VNPAQFAPHEDLATYPRTLESDLDMLSKVSVSGPGASIRTPSAVFLPPVKDMYPSGIVLDVDQQKGTFIEVKGYGDQMEGKSRPAFFRGVATVVTKLFNAVEVSIVGWRRTFIANLVPADQCILRSKGYTARFIIKASRP